jgi:phosphatidylglycerol---prolipoprotein diacylglyceryl transferase
MAVPELHFLFEALAYFLGFQYYQAIRRNGDMIPNEQRYSVIIAAIMGAAMGSKLLGFLEHPELAVRAHENVAYFFASKTILGGLLGGVIGVEIAKKFLRITRSTGDLFCFPIILGMMVGRIGCFFEGVSDGTWGNETTWITGMNGGDGVLRHPMPLYEIFVLASIWLALLQLKKRVSLQEGALFKLFMVGYLLWRLVAEFFKPVDIIEPLGVSAIQLACLLGLVYYSKVIINPKHLVRR